MLPCRSEENCYADGFEQRNEDNVGERLGTACFEASNRWGGLQQQQEGSSVGMDREGEMRVDEGASALQQAGVGGKGNKDKVDPDYGTNLKSLVIELDFVSGYLCAFAIC